MLWALVVAVERLAHQVEWAMGYCPEAILAGAE